MSTNVTPANYICYYAQDHLDFRLQELISIKQCVNLTYSDPYYSEKPFLPTILDKESDGQKILERTVLMRYIIESWACACTIEEILDQKSSIDACAKKIFVNPNVTFRVDVEGFNKKLSMDCKMSWIKKLEKVLQFEGKVKMKDPDHVLCLLLDFGLSDEKEKTCQYIYFGRLIGNGQRDLIHKYSLKTRYFIGNTSMDPQLSFLMANQGQVKKGSFVFDPFVGTGSILVCCAHFGAYTAGSDIDRTIIYGRGRSSRAGNKNWRARDELIRTNYQQYGLVDHYVDVMVADICRTPLRCCEIFDAIITDPPYGIREGGRRLTARDDNQPETSKDSEAVLFPSSSLHQLSDIITDLIKFAALYLRLGADLFIGCPSMPPRIHTTLSISTLALNS
eukprot:gene11859-13092_t